jgi:tricorn protease
MSRKLTLIIVLLCAAFALAALQPEFATDPAISPDGNQICFVYSGDLWLVPFQGGSARRITNTEAAEWSPCWSPDGKFIAFNSNREGTTYTYLISSAGGSAWSVFSESYSVSDWFSDSQNLLCTRYNLNFGSSLYKVPVDGTRPTLLAEIGDRYASLSPDNTKIIFNRHGDPYREAYQGALAGELWQIDISTKVYSKLTDTPYTERYPRYSSTSNSLYFCASDGDRFQVYKVDGLDFSTKTQLTDLNQWSARDISIARKNDRIVFECFDEIWRYDPARTGDAKAAKVDIFVNEDMWTQDLQKETLNDEVSSFAVSGDELLLAFKYGYDTFFIPRKGGDVKQVTHDQATVGNMEFLDDKRTLLMQLLEDGKNELYTVKCDSTMSISPFDWFGKDSLDVEGFSRDSKGRWVIYYGDKRLSSRIAIADKDLQNLRPLSVNRPVVSNVAFNSTGEYAVFATTREDVWTRELWLYDLIKNTSTKLINDDSWINNINWTNDEKSLLLSRSGGIYRLDLVPRDEFEYDKDNWKEIFTPELTLPSETSAGDTTATRVTTDTVPAVQDTTMATKPDKEPQHKELNIVWAGLDKRLKLILSDPGASLTVQKVIDDSTFYYLSDSFDSNDPAVLKKANIYGSNVKKEFELGKYVESLNWVNDTLYYMQDGKISYYNTGKGADKQVTAAYDYAYSTKLLNMRVFEQAWGKFGLNFYDPNMHGKNWQTLYELYHPFAEKARSIGDIAAIINEMIGDVNASHTGFYPRNEDKGPVKTTANLGVEYDYTTVLPVGITIKLAYPTSRLASLYNIKSGDIILAIDGKSITPRTPIDSLLADKVSKKIRITCLCDSLTKEAVITGLSWGENRSLYYTWKVNHSKEIVDSLTAGRIGYVHIPAMGYRDYDNFQREVFRDNADKEALIIDVRGNSGGHVHDDIISLLNRKPYAWSTSRRYTGEKNLEPRRNWMRPTIVLVDESSFSDGEIFPTVYQELKLGKLVGVPSSGSVIGTWEFDLLDGSSMRLPGSGWYKMDGTNMEGHGVVPDIIVENTPEDEIAGKDAQLLRAVEEILKEVQ